MSNADGNAIPNEIQAQILEAFASSSRKPRPQGALLRTFEQDSDTMDEDEMNKYELLCPRAGCGCKILLKTTAKRVVKENIEPIDPATLQLPPSLPPIDATKPSVWWHIVGGPMAFENISFSKSIGSEQAGSTPKKLLACADCDLGPLGWNEGDESWLSISRVSYRTQS